MQTRFAAALLTVALSLGGGVAYAATHGGGSRARQRPARTLPASNVHYPCRHHTSAAATASL
ncbi:MAG TPA: hypothetical protein VI408_11535 [Gaiellaceae bacterium]